VFFADYRGYGKVKKKLMVSTPILQDVQTALWLKTKFDENKIIILGILLGDWAFTTKVLPN